MKAFTTLVLAAGTLFAACLAITPPANAHTHHGYSGGGRSSYQNSYRGDYRGNSLATTALAAGVIGYALGNQRAGYSNYSTYPQPNYGYANGYGYNQPYAAPMIAPPIAPAYYPNSYSYPGNAYQQAPMPAPNNAPCLIWTGRAYVPCNMAYAR